MAWRLMATFSSPAEKTGSSPFTATRLEISGFQTSSFVLPKHDK
jgi:hypothetical protein